MSSNIQVPKICQHCGQTFIAKTTVTKFCSHKCSSRNYKKRAKEAKVNATLEATTDQLIQKFQTSKTSSGNQSKEFLSINEVSDLLGVSRWTINRMVQRGDLTVKQVGRKKIMSRQQIDAFFQ
ncbi:MAG: helix-turn-helix domain-containing protein [Spirosomataceae bacterium]